MSQHSWLQCLVGYFTNHRTCLNCLIFILTVTAVILIKLIHLLSNELKNHGTMQKFKPLVINTTLPIRSILAWPYNNYGFHPVNDKGVFSFWNVCIEVQQNSVQRETDYLGEKIYFNETKRIVVYNSFYRNGMQKLYVAGSHNSAWNQWDLHFTRDAIPFTHTFLNTTAFFVAQTCPANFHHFWIDEFVPLFDVVRQANRLHAGSQNQIIYRLPTNLTKASTRGCYNKTVFEEVLASLYTATIHDVFYNIKADSCFSSAVFGIRATMESPRIVVDHVLQYLNVSMSHKQKSYITIIQRTHRQIINVHELLKEIKSSGFRNTRIVNLEKLGAREQVKVAASSRVMIGVQGAGLQWAVFMPPKSILIEIAWPYKFWGFYFQNYVTQYKIVHHKLFAQHVRVNWTSYEQMVRKGNPVHMEERIHLLKSQPKTSSLDNIWKWADALVNKEDLINILSTVLN